MAAAAVGVTAVSASVVLARDKEGLQIRNNRISHLPPDWAQRAREQLGEDTNQTDRHIRQLRAKLKGAAHLEPDEVDDAFYVAFLRARKYDIDKTVKLIRRYCDMRRRYPDVCKFAAPSRHLRFHQSQAITLLEDRRYLDAVVILGKIGNLLRTLSHSHPKEVWAALLILRRIVENIIAKLTETLRSACAGQLSSRPDDFTGSVAERLFEFNSLFQRLNCSFMPSDHFELPEVSAMYAVRQYYSLLEAVAADPKTQVAGVHILLDLAGFGFRHARLISPSFVRATVSLTQDSFPLRCKGVHIVNQPFGFDALYNVFKPFLSEKLRKRVRIHGSNWTSLHQYLPPQLLPRMYGGLTPGLDNTSSLMRLTEVEQAMMSLSLAF